MGKKTEKAKPSTLAVVKVRVRDTAEFVRDALKGNPVKSAQKQFARNQLRRVDKAVDDAVRGTPARKK